MADAVYVKYSGTVSAVSAACDSPRHRKTSLSARRLATLVTASRSFVMAVDVLACECPCLCSTEEEARGPKANSLQRYKMDGCPKTGNWILFELPLHTATDIFILLLSRCTYQVLGTLKCLLDFTHSLLKKNCRSISFYGALTKTNLGSNCWYRSQSHPKSLLMRCLRLCALTDSRNRAEASALLKACFRHVESLKLKGHGGLLNVSALVADRQYLSRSLRPFSSVKLLKSMSAATITRLSSTCWPMCQSTTCNTVSVTLLTLNPNPYALNPKP
jgi:hypothetical protein